MPQRNARIHIENVVHCISATVNFNTANIATGVVIGTMPAGALIVRAGGVVETAFNAATTNVLTVGREGDSGFDDLVTASTITEATPGSYVNAAIGLPPLTVDTDVVASYTQSGTAATTGKAHVWVEYIARIG